MSRPSAWNSLKSAAARSKNSPSGNPTIHGTRCLLWWTGSAETAPSTSSVRARQTTSSHLIRNLERGARLHRHIDTGLRDIHPDKDCGLHSTPPCLPSLHNAGSRPSQLSGLVNGGTGRPELTHGLKRPGSLRSVPLPLCHDAKHPMKIQGLAITHAHSVPSDPVRPAAH